MYSKTLLAAFAAIIVGAAAGPAHIQHKRGQSPDYNHRGLSFDYNNHKVYGVNLGGWFVLEPWITPTLFQQWATANQTVVDEYTYCKALGKSEAHSRLQSHWNSWITQGDFKQIAAAGLNHVRIPIGYWAIAPAEGDPYVQGQADVLDRAIGWARSAGLKVLLDVHGAPGSQNGFDNSGRQGAINWQKQDPKAIGATAAVTALARRYASQSDVVTSIAALNEPANWGLDLDFIKDFYQKAWSTIRDSNPDTALVIHDAFLAPTSWNGFMNNASKFNNVMLDTHQYQVFSNAEVARTPAEHVQTVCRAVAPAVRDTDKWTIVGEWSGALTDCARWLNGLGKGARFDGTFSDGGKTPQNVYGSCAGKFEGPVEGLADQDKKNIRSFIEAQLDVYGSHTGWIFWTWKAESAPEWNMKELLAHGLFPQPLSDRRYPGQCK